MAEAAAACALVGAAPAAPRPHCRRRQPACRRVAGLRCRAAAGEGTPTPLEVLRKDVSFLGDLHGELVAAHRSAHDEVGPGHPQPLRLLGSLVELCRLPFAATLG